MKVAAKRILVMIVGLPLLALLWLLVDGTRPYLQNPKGNPRENSQGNPQGNNPQGANQPVVVDIPRGVRTIAIAAQLEEAGVIRSRWTFLGLHLLRWRNSLKAGEYDFSKPSSTLQVLNKIIRGDVSYEVLTIPEGDNRFDIAGLVAAQGFSTRDEFLRATEDPQPIADLDPDARDLEGYLFPDSYRLPRHARPAEIVHDMVERFRQVAATLRPGIPAKNDALADPAGEGSPNEAPAKIILAFGERSLREIVTVASMVEKETSLASERPVVAGVFYTRLKLDLPLQCDPTVVYAALLANRFTGKIRKEDLTFDSPYNTYVQKGLPVGPIANPGRAALLAALHPQSSDYLYFVSNDEGGHVFSRTLDEHNAAVEKYREEHAARLNAAKEAIESGSLASSAASSSNPPAVVTAVPTDAAPKAKDLQQKPSTAVAKSVQDP